MSNHHETRRNIKLASVFRSKSTIRPRKKPDHPSVVYENIAGERLEDTRDHAPNRHVTLPTDCPGTIGSKFHAGDHVVRIAQTANGQSMRHLTGRKAFQSQAMFLLKAQGAFHTEAGIEPLIAKRLEFDPAVVRMRSQPLRVDLVIDGKPVSYTPDMAVLFDNGDRAIWEVKPDWHHLQDDHYMRKLTLAAFTFLERGWHFRTLVRAQFDETSSETNRIINDSISLMFPSRLTVITESQKAAVARLLIAGSSTLGAVCAVIGGTVAAARARAYAMMARRLINIDLTRPLTDSSPVHAVAALPDYLPPLRF